MSEAAKSTEEFTHMPRVAYFSMEIALENDIPTCSGGLGVLAGDSLRAAADIGVPMVAVTLVSRAGYFRPEIDPQGRQIEHADDWDPARYATAYADQNQRDSQALVDAVKAKRVKAQTGI